MALHRNSSSVSGTGADTAGAGRARGCDVLLVVTHVSPGGTREVLQLIRRELEERGLDVAVAALYRGPDADGQAVGDILLDRTSLSPVGYAAAFIRLLRHVAAARPSAIVSFMPAANIMAGLAAAALGVKCRIATLHQPAWTQHAALRPIDRALGRFGLYTHIVAVAESIRTSFLAYPRAYLRRLHVIPNAVAAMPPKTGRAAVRLRHRLRQDAVLLVSIGRLSAEKNLLNTIAGAAQASDVQLAIVGDGPLRDELEVWTAATDQNAKVVFLGPVGRQTAADILHAADVFVQLSHFEGRSLALLEAVAAEKAIVASDIPAQREVLTLPGGALAGLLCDPADVNAIARTISSVAADADLRRDLATRAARLKEMLDPHQMGQAYASLIAPFIADPAEAPITQGRRAFAANRHGESIQPSTVP